MADPTHTDTADSSTDAPSIETSDHQRAPVAKVTRAKATAAATPRSQTRTKTATGFPLKAAIGVDASSAIVPSSAAVAPVVSRSSTDPSSTASGERSLRPASVEIYQGGADSVEGDTVTITQGGASIVNAGTVQVRQGGIANAQADEINVTMGGVALARAERVSVEMGGMGFAFAREAHLTQGAARSVIAQDVHVDQSLIGTALAGRVTFERPSGVFLLIAGRVDGPVQTLLDWRGAIAFGAIFGLLVGLIRRR